MVIWTKINKILDEQRQILKEMTSISTTALTKGGKKQTLPLASPAQRSLDDMLTVDKIGNSPAIQNINSTLNTVQETMLQMQQAMAQNHIESKGDMQKIDSKIEMIQGAIEKNTQKIQVVDEKVEVQEKRIDKIEVQVKRIDKIDHKIIKSDKETEHAFITYEMDKSMYFLRFQNIEENKDEDLEDKIAGLLAGILQKDKGDFAREIDDVYRVQTSYARRHNLPREVHVRFARRRVKEEVYMASRGHTWTYKEKEINTLKQIPRRVREQRREYKFLADILNRRQIQFRWSIPEGMQITWEGRRVRVENIEQAQEIYDQLRGAEEEAERGGRREEGGQETARGEEEEAEKEREKGVEERQREEGVKTRSKNR